MDAELEIDGLCAFYGRVQVLFDLSFGVGRGETLALLGANGAGKSTLLRTISGLHRVSSGSVVLSGVDITTDPSERRVQKGLAHLQGGQATFGPLTVEENLAAAAHRYRGRDRRRRIDTELSRFPELGQLVDREAAVLSGGQEQMLALAMALLHEPALLMIDELSLGLAPLVIERVIAVVGELQAGGTTIVVVEQSLNVALSIAHRVLVLEHGRIRHEGPAADLLDRDDLARSIFLGV